MSIKVAINGFGRIGRLVFRAGINCDDIEFLGINDPGMTPDYMAYMLRYDTTHGKFPGTVAAEDGALVVNGHKITIFTEKEVGNIDHILGIHKGIIQGNDLHVIPLHGGAENKTADTAKTIDTNLGFHL